MPPPSPFKKNLSASKLTENKTVQKTGFTGLALHPQAISRLQSEKADINSFGVHLLNTVWADVAHFDFVSFIQPGKKLTVVADVP